MDRFSVRNGLQEFANQNNCSATTRRRIWQVFAKRHVLVNKGRNVNYDVVEDILAYFGQEYQFDNSPFDNKDNCNRLNRYICNCTFTHILSSVQNPLFSFFDKSQSTIVLQFKTVALSIDLDYYLAKPYKHTPDLAE